MKTKEELNAIKEEYEAMNKKLAALTDEELEQVAGGGNRRTDDPAQEEAHRCFTLARVYVEQSPTLPGDTKCAIIGVLDYLWDRTLSWHLADPDDLMPKVQEVIALLDVHKNQEDLLRKAWDKMKTALACLEELKRKDA